MGLIWRQDFEAGSAGTNVTAGSTGGAGQIPVTPTLGAGATVTFVTVGAGLAAQCQGPAGSAAFVGWTVSGDTDFGVGETFTVPAGGITAAGSVLSVRTSSSSLVQAQIGTDRKVRFIVAGGGTLYTTPSALVAGTRYLIEMCAATGTTTVDGKFRGVVRDAATLAFAGGMTSVFTVTAGNVGAGVVTNYVQAGKVNTTADTGNYVIDNLGYLAGAYAFPSEAATLPPVAAAGPNQSVEPWRTVTLDASGSSDPNSAALTYLWTPPAGITLSSTTAAQPTFAAPPDLANQTYTFSLTVDNGTTTAVDTVAVTVLSATERLVTATGEVPLRTQSVA